jgi:tetratricopeptide (TPR) repeat protein
MQSMDEIFSQGLSLMKLGNEVEAIVCFSNILKQDSGHFGANYMLACEYAAQGEIDQARQAFVLAMVRDPDHIMCRFQAGLLELTSGNLQACAHLWARLEQSLPDDHYVKLFVQGCLAMAMDRFDEAIILINRGLELNQDNPALSRDMNMLLHEIASGTQAKENVASSENIAEEGSAGSTLSALNLLQVGKTRH